MPDNKDNEVVGHVSIRNVNRQLWHRLKHESIDKDVTVAQILNAMLAARYDRPQQGRKE